MLDWSVIAPLGTLAVAACTVIGFWMNFSDRITKAHGVADAAQLATEVARKTAVEANELARKTAAEASLLVQAATKEANERVTVLAANFSLYREQVLEKFVTYAVMEQFEKRILEQQAKSEERLTEAIKELTKQFERIVDVRFKD